MILCNVASSLLYGGINMVYTIDTRTGEIIAISFEA
nr:MAG TPA: protein of unknown function (DUF3870) [Bacteriophage sp.]